MKILHVTPSYKPAYVYGGPIKSIAKLCEQQASLGFEITVFTTRANGKNELPVKSGITYILENVWVVYFNRCTKDHSHFSPALLWRFFKSTKEFDTIHIHSWWNLVSIPVLIICWLRGVRPVFSPRGMLSPYTLKNKWKRLFHQLIGRWLLMKTSLHATSTQEAKEALEIVPGWSYFILPNILDLPPFGKYNTQSLNLDLCQMIFLSRIHPKKGIELLFSALAQLDFPWELKILGEGDNEYTIKLKSLAQELSIDNRIEWVGWVEGEEKFQLLANAHLFLLPSQNENFANAVIESLAVGTPVIISDQVGLSDYVRTKKIGWIIPLESSAWETTIRRVWYAENLRTDIRYNAPDYIYQDFGADLVDNYIKQYRQFES